MKRLSDLRIVVVTLMLATTAGSLKANDVTLDADADGATRVLKFAGGTWEIDNKLTLKSDQTSGTDDAKLWVVTGTANITGGAGTGILEIDGGDDTTRRVDLDIDATLQAEETRFLGDTSASNTDSYCSMDVASGVTAKGGTVIFQAGTVVSKSGSGTFKSGS